MPLARAPLGVYSKHYYAGSERIVSRIGELDSGMFTVCVDCMKPAGDDKTDFNVIKQLQINDLQQMLEKAKLGKAIFKEFKPYTYEEAQTEDQDDDQDDSNTNRPVDPPPDNLPIYFYHPDHLGTSTALTDFNGRAYQFFLNLPFGETMAEQKPPSYYVSPYKFNGKELDEETGLYY